MIQCMNRYVDYELGKIVRVYNDDLDKRTAENYEETHVAIDLDNGQVLDFADTIWSTYKDVSSGGQGFTICVRISEGHESKIESDFVDR